MLEWKWVFDKIIRNKNDQNRQNDKYQTGQNYSLLDATVVEFDPYSHVSSPIPIPNPKKIKIKIKNQKHIIWNGTNLVDYPMTIIIIIITKLNIHTWPNNLHLLL